MSLKALLLVASLLAPSPQAFSFQSFALPEDDLEPQWPFFPLEADQAATSLGGQLPLTDGKPLDPNAFYHLHFPKAAGASFKKDALKHLPTGAVLESEEGCYYRGKSNGLKVLVLFREPRELVLSQYNHCQTSPVHSEKITAVTPLPQTFEEFLSEWKVLRRYNTTTAFGCYYPVDMQSHRMLCRTSHPGAIKDPRWAEVTDEQAELAIQNMLDSDFVGLKEFYPESLCLLHALTLGRVPSECTCAAGSSLNTSMKLHGVQQHNLADYPAQVVSAIDSLTMRDRKLYKAAVQRFARDIEAVEKSHGKKILCRPLPQL